MSHGDIVTYLVFSANFVTLEQMKAYKALESHNDFSSGWVKHLSAKQLHDNKIVVLGEVSKMNPFRDCKLRFREKTSVRRLELTALCAAHLKRTIQLAVCVRVRQLPAQREEKEENVTDGPYAPSFLICTLWVALLVSCLRKVVCTATLAKEKACLCFSCPR